MRKLICLVLCAIAIRVPAQTLEVEYSRFYSHVSKLAKQDTADLRFAFGFQHIHRKDLCTINKAYIHTQKKDLPLEINQYKRFTVPVERALKLADARVVIDIEEQANHCDLSVQLETDPKWLKSQYSAQDLQHLLAQYEVFFDNMGGLFSFMMPDVTGLIVQMPDDYQPSTELASQVSTQQQLMLSADSIKNGKNLNLGATPKRIIAQTDG